MACRGLLSDGAGHASAYPQKFGRALGGRAENHHKKCTYFASHPARTLWVVSPASDDEVYIVDRSGDGGFDLRRDLSADLAPTTVIGRVPEAGGE